MLYNPLTDFVILVDISDRVFGHTVIKQRALFKRLTHLDEPENPSFKMDITVQLYAQQVDGSYGERLQGNGFRDYERQLSADNDSAVDPNTGKILLMRSHTSTQDEADTITFSQQWPAESQADFLARCEADERTLTLQGLFFLMLRAYSPIDMEELIRTHIAQADVMGRFS